MKDGVRQSMAWLHTWAGLLPGWLLYAIFACGTIAYWNGEITRWMQPEITQASDPVVAVKGAEKYLRRVAPDAKMWFITPPGARSVVTEVFWQPAKPADGIETSARLDPSGKPMQVRDTKGGNFFYRFHFDLYGMPVIWARLIVGVAAMGMLVAILSGIITHKKIFADFFLLRFGKGQRSWLDAHNVTAVLALPFHLMITYTGLVTIATLYMPWAIAANYSSQDKFISEMFPDDAKVERADRPAPLAELGPMLSFAQYRWGADGLGYVRVSEPGDASAKVSIQRSQSVGMDARGETLIFNGVTGKLVSKPQAKGAAAATEGVMVGLHAGRYADPLLRWLYFLSGVGGTVMVASGLILWVVKRRARLGDQERPHAGFVLVERLNAAVIAGFPAAVAAYFLANRLLPTNIAHRPEMEIRSFFLTWAFSFVLTCFCRPRMAWLLLIRASALLYLLVPIVSALTTDRGLMQSLASRDWVFAGFDLVMLVFAAVFALASVKFEKAGRNRSAVRRKVREMVEA